MKIPKIKRKISSYLTEFGRKEYENLRCFFGDETGSVKSGKIINIGLLIMIFNSANASAYLKGKEVAGCDAWSKSVDSHGTSCYYVTEDVERYKNLITSPPVDGTAGWKHVVWHQNYSSVDKMSDQLVMGQQNCFEKVSVYHNYCNTEPSCKKKFGIFGC